jgi:flavin reductase
MVLKSVAPDERGFKAAMGSQAASVNVITMWDEERRPLGMTATAFASVSVDPLQVLVCVNRSTRTYHQIATGGAFGVNILGSPAQAISDYCARPGADKQLATEWLVSSGDWRCPALGGALAFLDCEIAQDVEAGSHAVLIGSVRGIGLSSLAHQLEPLLHFRGSYRQMERTDRYRRPRPLPISLEDVT